MLSQTEVFDDVLKEKSLKLQKLPGVKLDYGEKNTQTIETPFRE